MGLVGVDSLRATSERLTLSLRSAGTSLTVSSIRSARMRIIPFAVGAGSSAGEDSTADAICVSDRPPTGAGMRESSLGISGCTAEPATDWRAAIC
jgi:hypothetical protein